VCAFCRSSRKGAGERDEKKSEGTVFLSSLPPHPTACASLRVALIHSAFCVFLFPSHHPVMLFVTTLSRVQPPNTKSRTSKSEERGRSTDRLVETASGSSPPTTPWESTSRCQCALHRSDTDKRKQQNDKGSETSSTAKALPPVSPQRLLSALLRSPASPRGVMSSIVDRHLPPQPLSLFQLTRRQSATRGSSPIPTELVSFVFLLSQRVPHHYHIHDRGEQSCICLLPSQKKRRHTTEKGEGEGRIPHTRGETREAEKQKKHKNKRVVYKSKGVVNRGREDTKERSAIDAAVIQKRIRQQNKKKPALRCGVHDGVWRCERGRGRRKRVHEDLPCPDFRTQQETQCSPPPHTHTAPPRTPQPYRLGNASCEAGPVATTYAASSHTGDRGTDEASESTEPDEAVLDGLARR
jgi:hypothetical protein